MTCRVCTWWKAYTFDNCLRRLLYKPEKAFTPYVKPGMTVADLGCGMGFNSIGLAKTVGDEGQVIAVDLQPQMLTVLKKRAKRAGVAQRIQTRQCEPDSIGVSETIDFALAFWVVHEVPDTRAFLQQVHSCLADDGRFLVAEPSFHVSPATFETMLNIAADVGLKLGDQPRIRGSRTGVFVKDR